MAKDDYIYIHICFIYLIYQVFIYFGGGLENFVRFALRLALQQLLKNRVDLQPVNFEEAPQLPHP